ncbi:disease resistance protein RGA5-like [Hordeum vulgare subsp. vulgare]|nr:disease resistance protein RGA5-like [Hordeum vulgare subsp. vulgare]
MDAALVSVATGALKPVLEKLAALLGDKYRRFKEVRDEIKFLTDELAAMHNFLLKMSEVEDEDPVVQDKAWMNEVRELSYDIEDHLDDFVARVDDDRSAKPDGFMEKIKYLLDRTKARRGIAKAIQSLKKQVVVVGKRHARYATREAISKPSNAMVDPRALAIFKDVSKLVGIDGPKDELIQLLSEPTQQQSRVVSIHGFGGLGKTTLANQVYKELVGQFDCHAFLSVSRNPDTMKVLRTILSQVTGKDYVNTKAGGEQQLITEISSFLLDKRYIVVVDDIWNIKEWNVMKYAFPITTLGSRIITTTRNIDVAQSCSSRKNIYKIKPLNVVHSRQLFCIRLFNSEEDCPSHLKEVSDQILEKCGGLPLAIIAISGLLANTESTNDQWDRVKKSIGCALERNPSIEAMIKILSLSYFDLPPHLKTCLLYLSIFPEDQVIKRKALIRRWISEGFIRKEERYTLHELGERCFNELINRSLIQPAARNTYGKVVSCRVHDTILDFIISKSIEENFVTLVGVPNLAIGTQSKVRRLSLQVKDEGNCIPPANLVLSHVRSLNVFGNTVKIPSMTEFRHLLVLDFGGCRQLENQHLVNIGRLFQLRYLNLRQVGVSELPKEIKHLQCLEMLDLRDTNVRELPTVIVNLGSLVHLLVDNCVTFPDGVSKMQALEMLKRVRALKQSSNFLRELGQLKNLRKIYLDLFDVPVAGVTKKCCKNSTAYQSLRNLGTQNLRSVTIWNGGSFLLEPWSPTPVGLKKLMTWRSAVAQVPAWVGSLVNLQKLRLEVEGLEPEDLCILGGLPALLTLDLEETTKSSKGKLSVSGGDGFRCLRNLRYNMMLMFTQGCMPRLERINIYLSIAKTESLAGGDIDTYDFGIENLPCLTSIECRVSGTTSVEGLEAAKAAMERAAMKNPNHPNLQLLNFHVGC